MSVADGILRAQGSPNSGPAGREEALFAQVLASPHFDFLKIRGLGNAQRARIMAVFELCRRFAVYRMNHLVPEPKSTDWETLVLQRIPQEMKNHAQEWLGFVPVFAPRKIGSFFLVERGSRTHLNIDPLELFARILSYRPQGFFLIHNHPSGDCRPSAEDLDLTIRAKEVSDQLGVTLYGHVIVSACDVQWVSL